MEVDDLICVLGISKTGIDFNSPDGQLCHIILLSLSSNKEPEQHRKFITLFNAMISDANTRTQLLDNLNSTEVVNIITDWEKNDLLTDDLG